ncbi:hypothetical protein AAFF_G00435120 [Aldrovandia affinis]|uniref:Otopetrin n=1 Tax=Aldrovandia affinis TaxID=143900 RepID=A0AAD7S8E3_9TELE|nr:hypothetical protein AAFF_G00435120 [Aldrovandia affinis]
MKDLDITDLSAMVEHGGLDIMCLNKHRNSSTSSSSTPEKAKKKKRFHRLRVSLTEDYPKKNAEILSAQYGTNLLLFGIALMLAISYHGPLVSEEHLLAYIVTIMIVQLLWMLSYVVRRKGQKTNVPEKDAHAGTRWLRGGITILALLSLIMDAFLIGLYVGYKACVSAATGVYPVIHALHTISQVYFLWFHIKEVVKTFETFDRFGVIHAVFTNLLLWCNGVMTESEHFTSDHKKRVSEYDNLNHTEEAGHEPYCNCTTGACSLFAKSLYYLYPFNIEYHIMVSAMLLVMWKNIGRTLDHHHHHHGKKGPAARNTSLVAGPVLGLVALTATIVVLVFYTVWLKDPAKGKGDPDNIMFYSHGIVMLACMCSAGTLGLLLYRADSRPQDSSKNPARQLDAEMLFGSSIGSWIMSWCTMVAVTACGAPGYTWTSFLYSLLLVLEKYVQNLFIIESLYRPEEEEEEGEGDAGGGEEGADSPGTQEVFSVTAPHDRPATASSTRPTRSRTACASPRTTVSRRRTGRPGAIGRKRQILKNIAIFLILCNISLWLLTALGARPQYGNHVEQETFGYKIWHMVLNFGMPLNLFYRMHSVAALFEVFQKV